MYSEQNTESSYSQYHCDYFKSSRSSNVTTRLYYTIVWWLFLAKFSTHIAFFESIGQHRQSTMSHTLEALLGESVEGAGGQAVHVRSLCGKERVLGLFFTANWSPPCRMFTPTLTSFYESQRNQAAGVGEQLEIVQVSWDKDAEGFQESTRAAPWLVVPFQDKDRQRKLSRKFGVHGVPRLVLLDGETGRVITRDGFERLTQDATGSGFPWRRKPINEVIKGDLLLPGDQSPKEINAKSALEGQNVIGFYFSAHWCLPCRYFDPELSRAYTELRARGIQFQVVFVSADRSEESFQRHAATMPWPSLPFGDPRNQAVKKHFGVDGIPMLILIDEKGNVITMAGRQALAQDPQCKEFPWYPKPVEDLTPGLSLRLNENACVILFTDGGESGLKQGRATLAESAYKEAEKGDLQDLFFFVAGEDEFSDNVRDFVDLDDTCPLLIILDSPEQNVYICPESKVTPKIATEFVEKFLNGELKPTAIQPMCADKGGTQAEAVTSS